MKNIIFDILKNCRPVALIVAAGIMGLITVPDSYAIVLEGEVEPGAVIDDGKKDVFDDYGFLNVNGQTYGGAVSGVSPNFSFAPETLDGVQVRAQLDGFQELGLYNGDPDYRIARWWFELTNASGAAKSVVVTFSGNLGSDSDTVQRFSSNGAPFSKNTSWVVSADNLGINTGDPAFGLVQNSVTSAIKPFYASFLANDNQVSGYQFVIAPNFSVSLVWFGTARVVGGDAPGDTGSAENARADIVDVLLDPVGNVLPAFLGAGLQPAAFAINHSQSASASNVRVRVRSAKRARNGTVSARGRASALFGVASVEFRVGLLTGKARGTTGWRLRTRAPGRIVVTAIDQFGKKSQVARVRVKR